MQILLNSKIILAILMLVVGAGIGNQLPAIKVLFETKEVIDPTIDSDGVPFLKNADHPVVDGVAMRKSEFRKKYCIGLYLNKTCNAVHEHNIRVPLYSGPVPRFGNPK